jgi:hypothetical protein
MHNDDNGDQIGLHTDRLYRELSQPSSDSISLQQEQTHILFVDFTTYVKFQPLIQIYLNQSQLYVL